MAEPNEAFFKFNLGDLGGVFEFASPEDLAAWCQKEVQSWQWVSQHESSELRGLSGWISQGPQQIQQILTSRQSDRSLADPNELSRRLEAAFKSSYCSQHSLHSSHPKAHAILALKDRDPLAAGMMLALASGFFPSRPQPFQPRTDRLPSLLRGAIENILFDLELKGAAEAQAHSLSDLRQQFNDQIGQQANLLKTFEALIEGSKVSAKAVVDEQTTKLVELHNSSASKFEGLLGTAKADLERYIESVKKKWALSEAVSYWEAKADYHKKRAFWFGLAWPTVGIVLASGIFALAWWLSGGLKNGIPNGQTAAAQIVQAVAQPNYWHIALLIIAVTLSIWFLRILVRVFLSHLHRQADAHERVTLINTYLALLQEGKEIVPDDRKIIIQTIFRPSASGFVKDDAAPASPWEFLSRKF